MITKAHRAGAACKSSQRRTMRLQKRAVTNAAHLITCAEAFGPPLSRPCTKLAACSHRQVEAADIINFIVDMRDKIGASFQPQVFLFLFRQRHRVLWLTSADAWLLGPTAILVSNTDDKYAVALKHGCSTS